MPANDDRTKTAAEAAAGATGDTLERAEAAVAPEPTPEPAALPATPQAVPAHQAEPDGSFPSPHIIYLGVVKNEMDAQLMRFRNGLEMLVAKIQGAEAVYQDSVRALEDETKRRRKELDDTRLSEVTRLQTQIGDVRDVIETYEAAIEKVGDIVDRQAQVEKAEHDAMKSLTEGVRGGMSA